MSSKIQLPEAFKDRMKASLGDEYPAFEDALSNETPVSIRLNPIKRKTAISLPIDNAIPWCEGGFYLTERPLFTADPAFHAGAYYVQEAASMLVDLVLRQHCQEKPLLALDLCAAPGGKSTILSSIIGDESLLIANEVIKNRASVLAENLKKWGAKNTIVTSLDAREIGKCKDAFDLILVDAPCSGEGLFRKDPKARDEWSTDHASFCAVRQSRILEDVLESLRPGGLLIYSTCTFNPDENESQVARLLNTGEYNSLKLDIQSDWGLSIVSIPGFPDTEVYSGMPHKLLGEGFFLAILRKKNLEKLDKDRTPSKSKSVNNTAIPDSVKDMIDEDHHEQISIKKDQVLYTPASWDRFSQRLSKIKSKIREGISLGTLNKDLFFPEIELLMLGLQSSDIPIYTLEKQEALMYLKGESMPYRGELRGWIIIEYEGMALGWGKALKGRINNNYPKAWRIRMNLGS